MIDRNEHQNAFSHTQNRRRRKERGRIFLRLTAAAVVLAGIAAAVWLLWHGGGGIAL